MALSFGVFVSHGDATTTSFTPGTTRSNCWVGLRQFVAAAIQLVVLAAFGAPRPIVSAQTVDIKLVNGTNGQPIGDTCVNVWVGHDRKDAMAIPTDNNGIARLRLTNNDRELDTHHHWNKCGEFGVFNPVVKYDDSIRVNVGYVSCRTRTRDNSWLAITELITSEVLNRGIVTANTCGKSSALPKPGEVVLYVRPLTWREKLKQ